MPTLKNLGSFLKLLKITVPYLKSAVSKLLFRKLRPLQHHTHEEVFKIFSSGAIAGYLNQDYYDVELTEDYISAFKEIVKKAFEQ